MQVKKIVLMAVTAALVLAPAAAVAGEGCCKKGKAAEAAAVADGAVAEAHCESCAKTAALAARAHEGCSKSAADLIATAKKSDCPQGAALAAKAEAGDEAALEQLVTMCSPGAAGHGHGAEAAKLASNAKTGCAKSKAKLVAMAKESGCEHSASLAAKAEAGDEAATAAIIAMYSATEE